MSVPSVFHIGMFPPCLSFSFSSSSLLFFTSPPLIYLFIFLFNILYSFVDTTGRGREVFTGERTFTTKDIEVYSVFY